MLSGSARLPTRPLVDEAWRAWRDEVAFAEKFVADSPDLGVKGFEPARQ